jgi:hypothetical protein
MNELPFVGRLRLSLQDKPLFAYSGAMTRKDAC